MLWLTPAGLRGGKKLEAYHQSRQPQPFSLSVSLGVLGLRIVVQDVAASLGPAVAAAANRFFCRRCGVLLPGSALRDGCMHVLGLWIVVPEALRLRQRMLSRLCGVSWVSCRGSGGLWSIFLFWTPAYFLIVFLVLCFFAVRTRHRLRPRRSGQEPHCTVRTETLRQRATQSHPNGCLNSGKEPHLPSPAEPGHGQEQHYQKCETTLRESRGNLTSSPGSWVFVWLRGLSVWSFVLLSSPLFPRRFCGVVFWVVGFAPSVLVS